MPPTSGSIYKEKCKRRNRLSPLAFLLTMKEQYRDQCRKFGLNVVYYRKMMRITQLELAELLDIQRSHISAIELANVGVSFELIFKMCGVFHIKPKELFDFRD